MKTMIEKAKTARKNIGLDVDIIYTIYINIENVFIRKEAVSFLRNYLHSGLKLRCPDEYADSRIVLTDSVSYPTIDMYKNLKDTTDAVTICHGSNSEYEDWKLMEFIGQAISATRYRYNYNISLVMYNTDAQDEFLKLYGKKNVIMPEENTTAYTADHDPMHGAAKAMTIDGERMLTPVAEEGYVAIIFAHNAVAETPRTSDEIEKIRDATMQFIKAGYDAGQNALYMENVAVIKTTTKNGKRLSDRKVRILAHLVMAMACSAYGELYNCHSNVQRWCKWEDFVNEAGEIICGENETTDDNGNEEE